MVNEIFHLNYYKGLTRHILICIVRGKIAFPKSENKIVLIPKLNKIGAYCSKEMSIKPPTLLNISTGG